jgi:aspartate/methionine/tyrosine aminotransferase
MHPTFSNRWREFESEPNALALAEAERRAAGTGLLDLTVSNPTRCGLDTPADWTRLLDDPAGRTYDPHPQGLRPARKAIAEYYARRGQAVDPDDLFLTSGTSEAYSHLFKLLANPGDRVLAPRPSYPLLHSLAGLESLQLDAYGLAIGEESRGGMTWNVDRNGLNAAVSDRTRAICAVQPNNPTGHLLTPSDSSFLTELAAARNMALIVDEVFCDYLHDAKADPVPLLSGHGLVFTLNGLSKILGLPQLKLAWIHVSGPEALKAEAKKRLEWICDAYLSVGIPAQNAVPWLLARALEFQEPLRKRLRANLACLKELSGRISWTPLWPQGGWSDPLRLRDLENDEAFAVSLIRDQGVLVHPGYFYDFDGEDILVVSLLTQPDIFEAGLRRMALHRESAHAHG